MRGNFRWREFVFASIRGVKRTTGTRLLAAIMAGTLALAQAAPPRLEKHGNGRQLVVDGRPFLILGGELGNSSASSAAYMQPHWPRLRAMHLNTVLAPVYWELVEPRQGSFDWTSLDTMLRDARANDLKLVLLWFGAWKNSMSTYVPAWVKLDSVRYPHVQVADGSSVEILSAFSRNTLDADARAFAAMMAHLSQADARDHTVLMVQVENEIGMLPIARERGAVADRAYAGPVPAELMRALHARGDALEPELLERWQKSGRKSSGTWAQVFGEDEWGQEVFTAWHYARFVESLVKAGKAAYDIPMYANVALNRTGRKPGEYPSGGPLPHLIDVWKAGAPSLDLLAPDIYFPNFSQLAARYRRDDNALFIPEANNATHPQSPPNALYAFGQLDALGFSPFSIESLGDAPNALSRSYAVLEQLAPKILASRGKDLMAGFRATLQEDATVSDAPARARMMDIEFTVSFTDPWTPKDQQVIANHGGLMIRDGEDYWFAGQGITITFKGVEPDAPRVGLLFAEEGVFDASGKWVAGRRLNGDQTHQGRHIRLPPGEPQIQKVRFYWYR
jgi:beta-galactosidase GanA